ncbi:MAG: hypothetical protein ACM3VT_08090 [Solirubrobacterales bacterium]
MEKFRGIRLLIVAAVALMAAGQVLAVPSIYNTGVDDTGTALPNGAIDTHWALTGPGGPAAVATIRHPAWVAEPAGSMWIAPEEYPANVTAPIATWTYSTTFELADLTGTNVTLSGSWASDNASQILLNGNPTGFSRLYEFAYTSLEDFVITSGFQAGTNTLSFMVENYVSPTGGLNPTGLLVANLLVTQTPVVPVPGAIVLASLGTCVIGYIRRRGIL